MTTIIIHSCIYLLNLFHEILNNFFKQWAPCLFTCFVLLLFCIIYCHVLSEYEWNNLVKNQRYKINTYTKERLFHSFSSFPLVFLSLGAIFYSQPWQLINRGFVQSCAFSSVVSSYCISLQIINLSLFNCQ